MDKKQIEILKKTIKKFGEKHQIDLAIEEMAELIKELIKDKRGAKNIDEISEEMADVIIMIYQLTIIFDNSDQIEDALEYKFDRLNNIVN